MENKCQVNYSIDGFVKMFNRLKEREITIAANLGTHKYIDFSIHSSTYTIYNFLKLDDVDLNDEKILYVDSGHFYLSIDLNNCLAFTAEESCDHINFNFNDNSGNEYSFVIFCS